MKPAHAHARPFILRGINAPIPVLPPVASLNLLSKEAAYDLIHPFIIELIQTSTAWNNATHGSRTDPDFKQYLAPLCAKVKAMEAALKPYKKYLPKD